MRQPPQIINRTICKLLHETHLPLGSLSSVRAERKRKRNAAELPYLPHRRSSHGGHHLRHHAVRNWWHVRGSLPHGVHSHGRIVGHARVAHLKDSSKQEKSV